MNAGRECKVQYVIKSSFEVLKSFKWLLDSYVLDYFVEDHWAKLPLTWCDVLKNIEPPDLCQLLGCQSSQCCRVVWPLSLLALQATRQCLKIPREKTHSSSQWPSCDCVCCQACSVLAEKLDKCGISHVASTGHHGSSQHNEYRSASLNVIRDSGETDCSALEDKNFTKADANEVSSGLINSSSFSTKVVRAFEKHVKPKKRHEVVKMAQVAAWTAREQGCQYVVDVGSGIGHLARMMTYGFGLRVCCLEAQDVLTTQARKLDNELEVTLSKHISLKELSQFSQPIHLNITLHPNVDPDDFVNALSTAFGISPLDLKFGIVGLHPCGDLGPILLRLFQRCPGACFINIVGCCYMKISQGPQASFQGYPMSEFVSSVYHTLSYEACELSCHAIEAYTERLAIGDFSDLMVHCFRATLERIIVKHWPHLRHSGIQSVKHNDKMTFTQYCNTATEKLNIDVPVEDLDSEETRENLLQWKRVVTFYTLRLLLAPLVESVILLDRLHCLRESGLRCILAPVFEPRISPRNHVLIAVKGQ